MSLCSNYYFVNIKEFADLFSYNIIFQRWIQPGTINLVTKNTLEIILEKLGIKGIPRTIDEGKESIRAGVKNVYNYEIVIRRYYLNNPELC